MTKGWQIFGRRVADSIETNIVDLLTPLNQVMDWEDDGFDLGGIPNLHSLVPYSEEARKPIFDCSSADGLRGAHLAKADGQPRAISGNERHIDELGRHARPLERLALLGVWDYVLVEECAGPSPYRR